MTLPIYFCHVPRPRQAKDKADTGVNRLHRLWARGDELLPGHRALPGLSRAARGAALPGEQGVEDDRDGPVRDLRIQQRDPGICHEPIDDPAHELRIQAYIKREEQRQALIAKKRLKVKRERRPLSERQIHERFMRTP